MNIKVIKSRDVPVAETGGEYATLCLEIYVNNKLPMRDQRLLVIHSVIENWFPAVTHDKIESLTNDIEEALDQL